VGELRGGPQPARAPGAMGTAAPVPDSVGLARCLLGDVLRFFVAGCFATAGLAAAFLGAAFFAAAFLAFAFGAAAAAPPCRLASTAFTSAAWPSAFTFGQWWATMPSGAISTVDRITPSTSLPYMSFLP